MIPILATLSDPLPTFGAALMLDSLEFADELPISI